ncbi:Uncharacterized protein Fot_37605 [Forsythia ovata]|uniref:Uncharacterized protein n=1 Tax=Forsythia ovata TaxID=205694 RepID=A0ABD1RZF8_9LAMI
MKKVLSEPNVKVVFHQTAVPVTLLSTWIIYPKTSALGHSTRCLAEAWLSEVDSLLCSRCRTCCAPLTKKGTGAAATWTPSFLLLPALSRAELEFCKGQAKPEGCYPNRPAGGTRGGPGKSYHDGQKSVFTSDKAHRRPSSAFFVFDEKNKISISESVFLPPPHLPPFVEPFL